MKDDQNKAKHETIMFEKSDLNNIKREKKDVNAS